MIKRIFYLAGFMASGKSTIGPILANTIGWDFYDLDKEVEKKEGGKIVRIFENEGEKYFRRIEAEILRNLSIKKNLIIALGGGTLINLKNRRVINKTGKLIFLKSSPDVLYKRLIHKRDRPVLSPVIDAEDTEGLLLQRIEQLMKERIKYYEQADYIFDTDKDSVGVIVDRIAKIIKRSI